jgi:hypothetical protein
VLHARFGRDRKAQAAFSLCLAEEPEFTAAYLDLANLKLLRGEMEEAAEVARAGGQEESVLIWDSGGQSPFGGQR